MEEGNLDFFLQMNSGVQVKMRMKMFQVRKIITTLFGIATVANLHLQKWANLVKVVQTRVERDRESLAPKDIAIKMQKPLFELFHLENLKISCLIHSF